jgi:cysteine desulfurase
MNRIYLDWNATTPPIPAVVEAMAAASVEAWGNPSSAHAIGRIARGRVEEARAAVADLAGCDPRDVVITSGGTEANNLALRSAFADSRADRKMAVLATSRLEHPSVTRVAEAIERDGRARVHWLHVTNRGVVDVADIERVIAEHRPALVALQAVNGETGVVQPVDEAVALCRRAGVPIHVDAVQAFGRTDGIAMGADTRSLAGHKMRGPKSIGALVLRSGTKVVPLLVGGSQERGMRPGTVDPVAAAGLAAAARHAMRAPARWQRLGALRDRLESELVRLAPKARVLGIDAVRAPHVTTAAFAGWLGAELVAAFDLEGIAVSSGTACSAGTAEPSPAVAAMADVKTAAGAVRFSLGEETTEDEIERVVAVAARVLPRRG